MPTYKLTIEYEGTRYSGWQTQGNTPKTVQGHLLRAAKQVLSDVEVGGAGRTDAGVHAIAQVAHLRTRLSPAPEQMARKINDLLPHDIHILRAERVADGFHARHDAVSRIYLYQISRRRTAFAKPFVWWIKDELDVEAMKTASAHIIGRQHFGAFTDKRLAAEDSRVVVVETVEVREWDDLILIRISASHFLWKMVRKLVAALVEVGRGTIKPAAFAALLTPQAASFQPTAPPSGLFLEAITYEGEQYRKPLEPVAPVRTPPSLSSGRRRRDRA